MLAVYTQLHINNSFLVFSAHPRPATCASGSPGGRPRSCSPWRGCSHGPVPRGRPGVQGDGAPTAAGDAVLPAPCGAGGTSTTAGPASSPSSLPLPLSELSWHLLLAASLAPFTFVFFPPSVCPFSWLSLCLASPFFLAVFPR